MRFNFSSLLLFIMILNSLPMANAEEVKQGLKNSNKTEKLKMSDIGLFNSSIPNEDFNDEIGQMRTDKLEWHKRMGHMTFGLMLATAVAGVVGRKKIDDAREARGGAKSSDDAKKLHLHVMLAGATLASYAGTAYMGLSAPKPQSFVDESSRVWHKRLAYVHGTSMILSPLLGLMALKNYSDGKDPSGLGKLHRPVVWTGFLAFTAAASLMTFEF